MPDCRLISGSIRYLPNYLSEDSDHGYITTWLLGFSLYFSFSTCLPALQLVRWGLIKIPHLQSHKSLTYESNTLSDNAVDFFLHVWSFVLFKKIYVIIIYFVMSSFITHSTLSVIYILYICIKFLNKTNGQTCEKNQRCHLLKNGGSIY